MSDREPARVSNDAESRFAVLALFAWLAITVALWTLAFLPLEAPPPWLSAAREVCFGTLPNGLPDSWGWITLIAGPLGVLGFLLAVWGRDLVRGLVTMSASWPGRVTLLLVLSLPLLGTAWVGQRVAAARATEFALSDAGLPAELPEGYPRTQKPAPALGLVNQHGQKVQVEDLVGRPTVVTFAYAHCSTICPRIVYNAKQAIEQTPLAEPQLLVVTLDPWRDTPSSLPSLVQSWRLQDLPAQVLSGEVDDVLATAEAWNVPIERDESTGEITHPGLVYLLDGEGRVAYTFNSPSVSWLTQALAKVS